jgi:hypothetical protein
MPNLTDDQVSQLQSKVATLVAAKSDSEAKSVVAANANAAVMAATNAAAQATVDAGAAAHTEAAALSDLVSFVDALAAVPDPTVVVAAG